MAAGPRSPTSAGTRPWASVCPWPPQATSLPEEGRSLRGQAVAGRGGRQRGPGHGVCSAAGSRVPTGGRAHLLHPQLWPLRRPPAGQRPAVQPGRGHLRERSPVRARRPAPASPGPAPPGELARAPAGHGFGLCPPCLGLRAAWHLLVCAWTSPLPCSAVLESALGVAVTLE